MRKTVHLGRRDEVLKGIEAGQPVRFLCGRTFVPLSAHGGTRPICKTCEKVRERLLAASRPKWVIYKVESWADWPTTKPVAA